MPLDQLVLGPGPSLVRYDIGDEVDDQAVAADVVERAAEYLFETVSLAPQLTVGDVLMLLDRCPVLRQVFRREFGEDLWAEACKGPLPPPNDEGVGGVEFVELYWQWAQDTGNGMFSAVNKLQLHGVGPVLRADAPDHGLKAGDRIEWSLSLTPARELMSLPLRLNDGIRIVENDVDALGYGAIVATARCAEVTLGQVIQGVLNELSFHGGAQDQAAFRESLNAQCDEIEAGTAELVSSDDAFDELFNRLDDPGFAAMFESLGGVPEGKVSRAMRLIPDEEAAGPHMLQAFGGRVVVKRQFADRPGREFRKAFRTASR